MSYCLTSIYPALADHLQEKLPPGVWIDLDQEQLQPENEALDYPLPYEAGVVLISFDTIEWADRGEGEQAGDALVRFTLARQVVQDTYTVTGQVGAQRAAAMAQLQLLSQLHQALQHFAIGNVMGALVRTTSQKESYTRPGLWVYSLVYKCRVYDTDGHQLADVATPGDVAPTPSPRPGRPVLYDLGGVILT